MDKWFEWAIIVILSLGGYIWNNHTKRLAAIEKDAVSKKDFAELKKDMKTSFDKLMNGVDRLNDKVVTRESAREIAKNEAYEALVSHQNKCPFVRSVLNRDN